MKIKKSTRNPGKFILTFDSKYELLDFGQVMNYGLDLMEKFPDAVVSREAGTCLDVAQRVSALAQQTHDVLGR